MSSMSKPLTVIGVENETMEVIDGCKGLDRVATGNQCRVRAQRDGMVSVNAGGFSSVEHDPERKAHPDVGC